MGEPGTGVGNERPMRLGFAAGAIAGLILAALVSVRSCRGPSVSADVKPLVERPDAERERRAEDILRRAQFAVSAAPSAVARDVAVFAGVYQIDGGSSVRPPSVREIPPLPEPGPDVPTPQHPADVGARLAESARLAAFDVKDDLP